MPYFRSFSGVVDVDTVARNLGWTDLSYEGFAYILTGGSMCMRASFLTCKTRPSEAALQHEGIRMALYYEFLSRFRAEFLRTAESKASARLVDKFKQKRKVL